MNRSIRYLVYNPPTLKLLSICRIRQSISCLGENVELNLIEKLTAGDFDDLRNPNVPISLQDMCKYLYKTLLTELVHKLNDGICLDYFSNARIE